MKTGLPLVTIVTPSFNQGKYIENTLLSVISQDYPAIEYIVVDGGSTDNTINILEKYHGKIKWISEPDFGPEDAINKGFRMANGEIIAWLASDDTYLPDVIKKVVDFFCQHAEIDMIYGKCYYIDQNGSQIWQYPTEPFDYEAFAVYNVIPQPAVFFRKNIFFDVGGLSLELKLETDYDLWIRIAQKYTIQFVPEFFANYRLHREAKTLGYHNPLLRFEECVKITKKYYQWVPANRVYPYCYYLLKKYLPAPIRNLNFLIMVFAVILSIYNYLVLNKGINSHDLKLLPRNLKKIMHGWELEDILNKNSRKV